MALSRDPAASSGREPAAGDARDEGDSGDGIGDRWGIYRYPSALGDVVSKGNKSTASRSKFDHTRLGDSCTDDRGRTAGVGGALYSATETPAEVPTSDHTACVADQTV